MTVHLLFMRGSGWVTQGLIVETRQTPTGTPAMNATFKLSGLGLAAAIASTAIMTSAASADPSFNCRYARTPVENAICDSRYLSQLDRRMARTYFRVMNSQYMKYENPAFANEVKGDHRRWISRRNACGYDEGCIARRYESYIPQLRAHLHYNTD
jgi:uncharacterized protein